ncbi:MAG: hypothetical protein ABFR62_12505 [Bacteroidota bacterium]
MKKSVLILLVVFTSIATYGQFKPCRFTVGYYMGMTDYSISPPTSSESSFKSAPSYTMSGFEASYNFFHRAISEKSAGNFDAGIGIYHFSDNVIMGKYGLKFNVGYKFSTAINAEKGLGLFARGATQLVYTNNTDITLVPRTTLGLCYNSLQLGIFGEYQNTERKIISEDISAQASNAYTFGIEFRFNIK